MVPKTKRLQDLFHEYEAHIGKPGSLRDAIEWGLTQGKVELPKIDAVTALVNDMKDALRSETRIDDQGNEYRANAAITFTKGGGIQQSLWGSVDRATTPHEFMVEHFGQRRKQSVDDCWKLKCDIDHYNSMRKPGEAGHQTSFDFTEDMIERQAERDTDKAAE